MEIEMAACALAIRDSVIPPTINLENPGEECDLDYTPNVAREKKVRVALNNSFGFGGHNATLVASAFERSATAAVTRDCDGAIALTSRSSLGTVDYSLSDAGIA